MELEPDEGTPQEEEEEKEEEEQYEETGSDFDNDDFLIIHCSRCGCLCIDNDVVLCEAVYCIHAIVCSLCRVKCTHCANTFRCVDCAAACLSFICDDCDIARRVRMMTLLRGLVPPKK